MFNIQKIQYDIFEAMKPNTHQWYGLCSLDPPHDVGVPHQRSGVVLPSLDRGLSVAEAEGCAAKQDIPIKMWVDAD
jgi:hypothetical protein